jgi:hypothetical protein
MGRTFTPWRLPACGLGCGSPSTCWRRLTDCANAGVFDRLHLEVLDRLDEQGRLDWERASLETIAGRRAMVGRVTEHQEDWSVHEDSMLSQHP